MSAQCLSPPRRRGTADRSVSVEREKLTVAPSAEEQLLKDPTPVDAADPVPATAPKPVDPLYPEVVRSPGDAAVPSGAAARLPYTGTEYSLGPIHFRPAEFQMEAVMLAFLAVYLASTFLIRQANRARASAWFSANEATYKEEFAGVGLGGGTLFKADGGDEFVSYATGRRGVEYVWTKVRTGAQDLVGIAYHFFRGIIDHNYQSGTNKVVSLCYGWRILQTRPIAGDMLCADPSRVCSAPRLQARGTQGYSGRQASLCGRSSRSPPQDARHPLGPGQFSTVSR